MSLQITGSSLIQDVDRPNHTPRDMFVNHPLSDVILRSDDGVEFRVIKAFIAHSSSFFAGMFSMPQPEPGSTEHEDVAKDGLKIIPVSEQANILELVLLLCYPGVLEVGTIEGLSPDVIIAVIQATVKYDMDDARTQARNLLIDSRWISIDPLRVLGLACTAQVLVEAKLTAG